MGKLQLLFLFAVIAFAVFAILFFLFESKQVLNHCKTQPKPQLLELKSFDYHVRKLS